MARSRTDFLHELRRLELERSLPLFPEPAPDRSVSVLEIGAGTGFQACDISTRGFDVTALDLDSSPYRNERVFPIVEFDGRSIPAADRAFDVVFSSNVLEHVGHIDLFLAELRRVMADRGCAIHVLPTPSWRLWSIVSHYPWVVGRAARLAATKIFRDAGGPVDRPRVPDTIEGVFGTLFPARHGERGNALTESYYYSKRWWTSTFERNGYEVTKSIPAGIFYSTLVLGPCLSIPTRVRLAKALGSSCRIYVLRKA